MRLSRSIEYAVDALVQLAESPRDVPVPCSELARTGKLPERFLLHVLRRLVEHGLLSSSRGVDGGYFLARRPIEITVCDIVEALEKPHADTIDASEESFFRPHARLKLAMQKASQAARDELRKVTLADLLKKKAMTTQPLLRFDGGINIANLAADNFERASS